MKVNLLNSDGFMGMDKVSFPAEVEAEYYPYDHLAGFREHYKVSPLEMKRIGCDMNLFKACNAWNFLPESVEVIE